MIVPDVLTPFFAAAYNAMVMAVFLGSDARKASPISPLTRLPLLCESLTRLNCSGCNDFALCRPG